MADVQVDDGLARLKSDAKILSNSYCIIVPVQNTAHHFALSLLVHKDAKLKGKEITTVIR